jgi:hypothetical protein
MAKVELRKSTGFIEKTKGQKDTKGTLRGNIERDSRILRKIYIEKKEDQRGYTVGC